MNRAYLILAHNDVPHLTRLINSLNYNEAAQFFIHVDGKQKMGSEFDALKGYSNVYFIEKRMSISWGGFSMVQAMIELLKSAMRTEMSFSHLVFLSGNDFPVKSPEKIEAFFEANKDRELIRGFKIKESGCQHCNNKINKKWYFDVNGKNMRLNKLRVRVRNLLPQIKKERKLIVRGEELDVAFGSQWFAITTDCATYILDFLSKTPEFLSFFKNTFAPDELFFHTLIFNSPFASQTINAGTEAYSAIWSLNNYTWIQTEKLNCTWVEKKSLLSEIKKNKADGTLPFLDETSYQEVVESPYIFARKFNTIGSKKLLEMLDKE